MCVCVCDLALHLLSGTIAVAGDSADINVFTNLGYKAFSFKISCAFVKFIRPSISDMRLLVYSHLIGSDYYQSSIVHYVV